MTGTQTTSDVVCPFCGLLCDDLTVTTDSDGTLESCVNACSVGQQGFVEACDLADTGCAISGQSASHDAACARAVELLSVARAPVISGLATDVNGARQAVRLAEKVGAVVDHMSSAGLLRNQRVMQRTGWMTTTLTELRNRADLVVLIGDDIIERFPRLVERVLCPSQTAFNTAANGRQIATLGAQTLAQQCPHRAIESAIHVPCTADGIYGVVNRLRQSLVAAQAAGADERHAGAQDEPVSELAQAILQSDYTVFIWSAGLLPQASADLVIDAVCQLIINRNETARCAGFPVGGSNADLTANQVCTWQTGLPLRTAFIAGSPQHDPIAYDSARLIEREQVDVLLWVSSLQAHARVPATQAKTIVLGHPASADRQTADVFIAVETPGVGRAGHMVRADVVVTAPLSTVRASRCPSAADVLSQLTAQWQGGASR